MSERVLQLERLRVRRAPGIDEPIVLDGLGGGLHLIVGPNESGKTSLCRAFQTCLWPSLASSDRWDVELLLSEQGRSWEAALFAGRSRWRLAGREHAGPALPPADLADCFVLRVDDLLSARQQGLALRISLALSGGYDLPSLVRSYAPRSRAGGRERKRLAHALQAERAQRAQQEQLARRAAGWERLERRRAEAERARERAELYGRVVELARARERSARLQGELEGYAPALARVRGDELRRVERLERTMADLDDRVAQTERQLSGLQARIRREALPSGEVDEAACIERLAACDELREQERQLEELEQESARERARLRHVGEGLGRRMGEVVRPSERALDERAIERLHEHLRARTDLDARLQSAQRFEELLATRSAGDSLPRELERADRTLGRLRGLLAVTALVAASLGAGFAVWVHPGGWAAVVAGLAVLFWLLLFERAPNVRLDEELGAWCRSAEAERRALESRAAPLEREARALAEMFGVDPGLGLAVVAQQLAAGEDARARLAGLQGAEEQARQHIRDLSRTVHGFLEEHGFDAEGSAASLRARLEELRRRSHELRTAASEQRRLSERSETARSARDESAGELAELYRGLEIEPGKRAQLAGYVEQLAAFQRTRAQRDEARAEVARLEELLSGIAPDALDLPLERARAEQRAAAELAAQLPECIEEMSALRAEIERASAGVELESAMAESEAARERLVAAREEALQRALAKLVLEQVTRDMRRGGRLDVLERAKLLFRRFTQHRHELRVGLDDDQPAFFALDTAREREVALEDLSAGTRMQLLIAARLAFAEQEFEQTGTRLPLFLDEALATTDPVRFESVAECVLALVGEGWQIFYLTSQPGDVARWRSVAGDARVSVHELGGPVDGADADAPLYEIPAAPRLPDPRTSDPAEFGAAIGAPRLDPRRAAGDVHVFYLLRDRLPLLRRLLLLKLTRLGPLERFLDDGAEGLLDLEDRLELQTRCRIGREFARLWQVGRGRAIEREVLQAAGVSDTFLEPMERLAQELDASASRLIQALRAGGLRRYQRARIDDLERWFADHGYLDSRPTLDLGATLRAVVSSMQREIDGGAIEEGTLARTVEALWHSADAMTPPAALDDRGAAS